jgi:predicted MFS family arabinose efflux permease
MHGIRKRHMPPFWQRCRVLLLIGTPAMADDTATQVEPGAQDGPGLERLTPMWVVIGLAMGPAVALGLARFGYALLLPPMRAELRWSFADAGSLNTANAAGYLVGALLAAQAGRRFGEKRVFAYSLLATALAVGCTGATDGLALLLLLRLVAGFTGALTFVNGASLTSAAAVGSARSRAPTLLGLYFSGAGLGVTASALIVPPLLNVIGWRGGWIVLGVIALVATTYGAMALRLTPAPVRPSIAVASERWSPIFMTPKLFAYGLYGAGYIAYATFIIAYLRSVEGFALPEITAFWTVVGVASIGAAFVWGPVLARLKGGHGTASTLAVVAVGTVIPLIWTTPTAAYISALLFGGSFLAVLAAVTAFARRAVNPNSVTAAIATLTVAFGMGQCIGPVLSGALADGPNGLRAGLWLSVVILVAAAGIALLQRETSAPR